MTYRISEINILLPMSVPAVVFEIMAVVLSFARAPSTSPAFNQDHEIPVVASPTLSYDNFGGCGIGRRRRRRRRKQSKQQRPASGCPLRHPLRHRLRSLHRRLARGLPRIPLIFTVEKHPTDPHRNNIFAYLGHTHSTTTPSRPSHSLHLVHASPQRDHQQPRNQRRERLHRCADHCSAGATCGRCDPRM